MSQTYADTVPFNYRSAEVYISNEATASTAVRVFPANERPGKINTMHASFRSSRFTELPCAEYSSGVWNVYNAVKFEADSIAPSVSPSGYRSVNGSCIESSYKPSKYVYTLTLNDLANPHGAYLSIWPYAILMMSNVNQAPTVEPWFWSVQMYSSASSNRTLVSFRSLADYQVSVLASGIATIHSQRRYYKIVAVHACVSDSIYESYQFSVNPIHEISAPCLTFHNQSNLDEVYFLEYGCEYTNIQIYNPP